MQNILYKWEWHHSISKMEMPELMHIKSMYWNRERENTSRDEPVVLSITNECIVGLLLVHTWTVEGCLENTMILFWASFKLNFSYFDMMVPFIVLINLFKEQNSSHPSSMLVCQIRIKATWCCLVSFTWFTDL